MKRSTVPTVLAICAAVACAPAPPPPAPADDPAETEPLPRESPAELGDRAIVGEALRGARAAREREAFGEASRALDRAEAASPALAEWSALERAAIAAEQGRVDEVDRILDRVPDALGWEVAWRARERARLVAGDTTAALAVAEAAAERLRDAGRRALAHQVAAEHLERRGDTAGAARHFRAAADAAPGSRAGLAAAQWLSGRGVEAAADHRRIGEVYLAHGNLARAAGGLEAWLAEGGGTALERADARYRLGMRAFGAGEHDMARRHLSAAAGVEALDTDRRARALLYAGRSQYRGGRQEDGVRTFRQVPERFPGTQAAAHSLFLLAGLAHDAGNTSDARQDYRAAVATGADAEEAVVAAARIAGMAILEGRPGDEISRLEAYVRGSVSPAREAAVRYWLGRLQESAGDAAAARRQFHRVRELDPVSYYALRAGARAGEVRLALPRGGGAADAAPGWLDEALFRFDVLSDAGFEREATFEMARIRERVGEDVAALYEIAEAALGAARHVEGILVGREIRRLGESWNERLLRIVWPFPYREIVERYAGQRGLEPAVVAALIRQESMFNPNAVSPAGAVGLMQLMPGTAADLARAEGLGAVSAARLRDPELNVRLGTRFLAELLQRYDGRVVDAFAAYNAGPTRMARWRQLPEYEDPEIFAERIPFDETRNYVKILQFNRELYGQLY